MKRVLLAAAVIMLASCTGKSDPLEPGQKRDPDSGYVYSNEVLVTMDDGCVLSKVRIRYGGSLYLVKCPTATVGTSWTSGKATMYSLSIPVEETDAQRKARESEWKRQQRDAALAKLTDAERALLGIPK